jgi:hypothetical protein
MPVTVSHPPPSRGPDRSTGPSRAVPSSATEGAARGAPVDGLIFPGHHQRMSHPQAAGDTAALLARQQAVGV